jgi:hypothetical protein
MMTARVGKNQWMKLSFAIAADNTLSAAYLARIVEMDGLLLVRKAKSLA